MRARNPCVLMRRLFRGRYVGLPMDNSKNGANEDAVQTGKAISDRGIDQELGGVTNASLLAVAPFTP